MREQQKSDNIMRTGQQYTLIDFDSDGTVIIKEGKIEISKGVPIDHGEIGLSLHWSGSLKELISQTPLQVPMPNDKKGNQ